jgi:hypothetical protein
MAAQNAARQYAFIPEATFGVTPSTPQMQLIELVDFDGDPKDTQLSDPSITAHGQTVFSRRGNLATEGTLEVMLCPDNCDWALEGVLGGTWTTNVLKVGQVKRSYVIEEGFTDIAQYRAFSGVTFTTLSVDMTPEALVSASFGFIGSTISDLTGTPLDATPTAITVKERFFHEGGTIQEGGSTVAYITGLKFTYDNKAAGDRALGNTAYRSVSVGKRATTGMLTALFENATLVDKYMNSTDTSISATLVAGAGTMNFTFPKVKYTSMAIKRAESGSVLVELGFQADYDNSAATSLTITRT